MPATGPACGDELARVQLWGGQQRCWGREGSARHEPGEDTRGASGGCWQGSRVAEGVCAGGRDGGVSHPARAGQRSTIPMHGACLFFVRQPALRPAVFLCRRFTILHGTERWWDFNVRAYQLYVPLSVDGSHDLRLQAKQLVDSASRPGAFQRVLSLQFDAFWQNHSRKVIAAGGVLLLYILWCDVTSHQHYSGPASVPVPEQAGPHAYRAAGRRSST